MSTDTPKDKHCDYNNFKRARYFHGMLMTDRDFREEQIYHAEKRRLLNRMLHGWGVVCGLGIKWESGKSTITIEQGMALDCHGNEIVVCEPHGVDLSTAICKARAVLPQRPLTPQDCEKLAAAQPNTFYIGIRYEEEPADRVPVYAPGGGCEERVCEYSRIREGFCIKIFDQPPPQPYLKSISPSLIKRFFDNCEAEAGFGEVQTGTAQGGANSTITLSQDASETDDYYNGMQIEISSGIRGGRPRTITDYVGNTRIATVDSAWDSGAIPNTDTRYRIINEVCLREHVADFKKVFCEESFKCPDCCPEEHYLILGTVEIDPNRKVISKLSLDGYRSHVLTPHMFRFIFSSLLSGVDAYFEVIKKNADGTSVKESLPDVNLVHTNPLEALCWLGSLFIDQAEINQKGIAGLRMKIMPEKPQPVAEVEKLRKDVQALRKAVESLQKKAPK